MSRLQTDFEVILLGCSCYAMGRAATAPDKCLILESGEGLGGEFVDALRADARPIVRPSGAGAAFYDELIQRGITDERSAAQGRVHLPAVNLVLNRMALECGLNILFRTRVFGIRQVAGSYELDAVCNARTYVFTCRRLVDTRSTDFRRIRRLDPDARFALGANMHIEGAVPEQMGGLKLSYGYLPGEVYAYLMVTEPTGAEREQLLSAFEARPAAWLGARLLKVAHAYAVWSKPLRERTDIGEYVPGCGFSDPVAAWAAGLAEGV